MSTTSDQMRAWRGPALFTYGFRPFFLGGALWAALAMVIWIVMLSGTAMLPTALDPVSWHAHEFLFGYLGAVIAGFMMTAVPNWTGRMPIVGWPLAGILALWGVGRLVVALSALIPAGAVVALDLAFPVTLALAMTREIAAGRNWRNLMMPGLLGLFILANALFHLDAARGGYPAQSTGFRLGLVAVVMMIALIGGRIVPSFTRNWLTKRGATSLPTPPGRRLDKLALIGLAAAGLVWITAPQSRGGVMLLAGAAVLHLIRLIRWRGHVTGAEPLVWVLHVGYAFVPVGALGLALSGAWPERFASAPAQHLWMAGAAGVMTLAVMTRATLGHTGHKLSAGRGTVALYLSLILSVIVRIAAGIMPRGEMAMLTLSGALWVGAFGGFALIYGPYLMRPRAER